MKYMTDDRKAELAYFVAPSAVSVVELIIEIAFVDGHMAGKHSKASAINHRENWYCCQCMTEIEAPHDVTAGGADSNYSKGAAAEFDYPATIECEGCGAKFCDGDLVELREPA